MSALFKLAPPTLSFKVSGITGSVQGWRKAIAVGGDDDDEDSEDAEDDGDEAEQQLPLAPSRFAEQLKERKFTNGADFKVVCDLYYLTLRAGFGARERLAYGACGWGDAEVEELAATLCEVAHPEVVELDLSGNHELRSLAALGAAVSGGALASLQTLNLSAAAS